MLHSTKNAPICVRAHVKIFFRDKCDTNILCPLFLLALPIFLHSYKKLFVFNEKS